MAQHESDGRLLLQDGNHRFEALSRDGAEGAWVLVYFDGPEGLKYELHQMPEGWSE